MNLKQTFNLPISTKFYSKIPNFCHATAAIVLQGKSTFDKQSGLDALS